MEDRQHTHNISIYSKINTSIMGWMHMSDKFVEYVLA